MTDDELREIEERHKKVIKGPWTFPLKKQRLAFATNDTLVALAYLLHKDIPNLLTHIRDQREEIERLTLQIRYKNEDPDTIAEQTGWHLNTIATLTRRVEELEEEIGRSAMANKDLREKNERLVRRVKELERVLEPFASMYERYVRRPVCGLVHLPGHPTPKQLEEANAVYRDGGGRCLSSRLDFSGEADDE